jgi:hypothetical protein
LRRACLFTGMLLALFACANQPPVAMSTQYDGVPIRHAAILARNPADTPHSRKEKAGPPPIPCHVHIGTIRDVRDDTQSLGMLGGRPVLVSDSAAWLESGLKALADEPAIRLAGSDDAEVTIRAELLKAYIMSSQLAKTSTVVATLHYDHSGTEDSTRMYRGHDTGVNWNNTADEAQGSLNRALTDLLTQVRADLLAQCEVLHGK